jgi:hypothetical protein
MTRGMALAVALALAACAGPQWEKPGISAETAAADYADCSSLAQDATQRDSAIQADILASRGHDWERSGTLATHTDVFAAEDQRRSGDVLGSCMRLRGYTPKE